MPGPDWFDKPGQPEWDNTDYARDTTWLGIDRGDPKGDWSGLTPLHHDLLQRVRELAEPKPTHEERVERCELMGMVFCNCCLKDGHVVVYNPGCPVHNHIAKLSR